jgi:hypothetical protein
MNDERRGRPVRTGTPHLDDATLERFAAGELDANERARARAHANSCPPCAALLEGVTLLQAGARQFDPGAPQMARGVGGRRWIPIAIAATIVLGVVVPMITGRLSAPTEPPSTARSARRDVPVAISPTGEITGMPTRFEWQPVDGARSYELLVFREDGTLLWERRLTGMAADRPAELQLPPAKYYWRVRAFTEENTTAESPLTAFEIKGP